MLNSLQIKNVALIDELEINFHNGFNVILGETGAGKSIIFDALNFVLGYKADKALIRNGEDQMKVIASFNSSAETNFLLEEFGIELDDDNLIIMRTLNHAGKSDCKINGIMATAGMLKQLSIYLLDSYGQHDNQILLKNKNHLTILDSYNQKTIDYIIIKLKTFSNEISAIQNEIKLLGGSKEERERQIELLEYQTNEIRNANLKENEDEEIRELILKLSNSEKIMFALDASLNNLYNGNESAVDRIKNALKNLNSIRAFGSDIEELTVKLEELQYEIKDISEGLQNIYSQSNYNEIEMEIALNRQELINNLKKKYGGSINSICEFLEKSDEKLDILRNSEIEISKKMEIKNKLCLEYYNEAKKLSELRKNMAKEIEEKLNEKFDSLGLKNAKLKVQFNPFPDKYENIENFYEKGLDNIEFLFSANKGEDFKPLSKTISGGELSRFMLAFKTTVANNWGVNTLVFDEIDSGISGRIAECVASNIAYLAINNQVICITHLPQVASMADYFYVASKTIKNDRTYSTVKEVIGEEVISQITLLIDGNNHSETAKKLAKELLEKNVIFKKTLLINK